MAAATVEIPGVKDIDSDLPETAELKNVTGMRITFQDLSYSVRNQANKKETINLLSNLNGTFAPGQMSALMGPSGSGKTTLLDVLAGRKTTGKTHGSILFAGRKPSSMFLRRYTGYVEQFDTLLDNLTVFEMLMYTAEMKCSVEEPLASKRARVVELMEKLALTRCRDVMIGNSMARGISGGQAKRVNIGIALVANARVLFLDEPTSGLDSYTANEVMRVVKSLVQNGITICATIHSPTPFAFQLFDQVTLLLGGHMIYSGENGIAAVRYFEGVCPDVPSIITPNGHFISNEAEWIVDLTTKADMEGRVSDFSDAYKMSDLYKKNQSDLDVYLVQASNVSEETLAQLAIKRGTTTPFWFGLKTILKYRMSRDYRDPAYLGPRIADKLIFSVLIMTIYWGIGNDYTPSNVNNITSILFMFCILPGFAATAYMPSIVLERPLYIRERSDGLYRPITYLSAKIIGELIIVLVISLLFSTLVFFPVQLQGDWVVFWIVYALTLAFGINAAYFIGALCPNMDVANAALPTYVTTLLFFTGLLVRTADIPNYWGWYVYLNPLHWAWGSLMVNQFTAIPPIFIFGGTETLIFFEFDGANKWLYILYEALFVVAFFLMAWVAIAYKKHGKR